MRSHKDDMLMKSVFHSEAALTPKWLRLTKARKLVACVTEITLTAMMLYSVSSESDSFITSPEFLIVLILSAVLLPVWFIRACFEEIRAYETASYIVSLKRRNEKSRFAANHIDYCDKEEDGVSSVSVPAAFCPRCGFVLNAGDNTCRTCGASYDRVWKIREVHHEEAC